MLGGGEITISPNLKGIENNGEDLSDLHYNSMSAFRFGADYAWFSQWGLRGRQNGDGNLLILQFK